MLPVLSVLLLTACELLHDDAPPPGQLKTETDRTIVRLVGVAYGPDGTVVQLEIERPLGVDAPQGNYFRVSAEDELRTEGFEGVDAIEARTSGAGVPGYDWHEYRLGRVLDPEQLVAVEVGRLCPAEAATGECIEGPWRLEWVPAEAELNAASEVLTVDETLTAEGFTVHINELRYSEEAVVVTLWSEGSASSLDRYARPRLRLPDGTELSGLGGGGSSEEPPRSLKTWHFPPLPDGVGEFWIEIEPRLREVQMSASFDFSLPADLDGLDLHAMLPTEMGEIEIGAEVEVQGEVLRLSHVQVGQGHLNFVVNNVTAGERTVHFGGTGAAALLTDANGVTYHPSGGGGGYQGQTSFRFQRVNLDAMDRMTLSAHEMGLLTEGPGSVHVVLPR